MPDGVYTLHLTASSGKKGYNASRRATIDRTRPPAPAITATSADPSQLTRGAQCAITVTPSTYARFTFAAPAVLPGGQLVSGPHVRRPGHRVHLELEWAGRERRGAPAGPLPGDGHRALRQRVPVHGRARVLDRQPPRDAHTPANLAPGDVAGLS